MNKGTVLLGVLGVSSGLLAGYALFAERSNEVMSVEQEMAKPLFYRNPMNPEVTSPVPAKGSMGMDYIPVYADETQGANPGTVVIDPTIQANIGLRTATAKRKAMSRTIRAVGRVDYDEEKLVRLHPKVEGWIRDMHIGKTGQPVENDDILLTIYSPKLVATQQEYLLSLEN
jgi:Cu(I)/Ag(I) efflux system membrane fusion protein